VEKPMLETNDEDWYELVKINLDKDIFQEEIKFLSKGSIVGIKGRIRCVNQNMQLIGERIQVF
jgi:hypothetical protein